MHQTMDMRRAVRTQNVLCTRVESCVFAMKKEQWCFRNGISSEDTVGAAAMIGRMCICEKKGGNAFSRTDDEYYTCTWIW